MLSSRLFLHALVATAAAANIRHILRQRQSDCEADYSNQICEDETNSVGDCRDAICIDPCYLDVPGIQNCCEIADTNNFLPCLNAQNAAASGDYSTTFDPTYTAFPSSLISSSASRSNFLTSSAVITPAPSASAGGGSASGDDPCSIVADAVNSCSTALSNFDSLPIISQGQCFCSAAGPDVYDSALNACVQLGSITLADPSLATVASTFCSVIGAADATPTAGSSVGLGGGVGGAGGIPSSSIPRFSTPVSTPASVNPQGVESSAVSVRTVLVTPSSPAEPTSTFRTGNSAPPVRQSSTAGASLGIAPADWLSILTALMLAALGA